MKDAQKPDHISLNALIGRLREGRFVIPDFQREFEWRPADIKELMRSIFLDYYIGSLLLWKGKRENFEALSASRFSKAFYRMTPAPMKFMRTPNSSSAFFSQRRRLLTTSFEGQ